MHQEYGGIMNARQVDAAWRRYDKDCTEILIVELIRIGLQKEAIEQFRNDYLELLVKHGLCKWQPEPIDNPNASELTEAFFTKYITG